MNSPAVIVIDSSYTSSPKSAASYPEITVNKNFIARDDLQLSVFQGDTLELLDDTTEPDWNLVRETFSGKIGLIPVEICESAEEKEARLNARINSIVDTKKTKDIPRKSTHSKSVSFASGSPKVIPIFHAGSQSTSSTSPLNEESKVLEDKFEAELNLRKILENVSIQQSQPNSPRHKKEPERILRVYCGNINGPPHSVFKTISAFDSTTWVQLERWAMKKYDITAARLDMVHSETMERIFLPPDFTLAQAINVARYATRCTTETPSSGSLHRHKNSQIQEIINQVRAKIAPPIESPSSYKLVLNSNIKRTNVFRLKIKTRQSSNLSHEKEAHLTVDYQDTVIDIVKILHPVKMRLYVFGRMGASELQLTTSGTISDAMRLFDCGPEGCMDPSSFQLIINIP